jgi:hypothetical protein
MCGLACRLVSLLALGPPPTGLTHPSAWDFQSFLRCIHLSKRGSHFPGSSCTQKFFSLKRMAEAMTSQDRLALDRLAIQSPTLTLSHVILGTILGELLLCC